MLEDLRTHGQALRPTEASQRIRDQFFVTVARPQQQRGPDRRIGSQVYQYPKRICLFALLYLLGNLP